MNPSPACGLISCHKPWIVPLSGSARKNAEAGFGLLLPIAEYPNLAFNLGTWVGLERDYGPSDRQTDPLFQPAEDDWLDLLRLMIDRYGVEQRVTLCNSSGMVVDGHHRLRILYSLRQQKRGVAFAGFELMSFESEVARREYQYRRQTLTRSLNLSAKREMARNTLRHHPEYSNRMVARYHALTGPTVLRLRRELELAGEIEEQGEYLCLDGRLRPAGQMASDEAGAEAPKRARLRQVPLARLIKLLSTPDGDCSGPVAEFVRMWVALYHVRAVSADEIANLVDPRGEDNADVPLTDWLADCAKYRRDLYGYVLVTADHNRRGRSAIYQLLPASWVGV